ncbi:MAG TPA: efflux RND transporter periplasmic adaptor subunit [Terracidiphilus sp.]|jgi:multidrug efflux system membrane fusion protein
MDQPSSVSHPADSHNQSAQRRRHWWIWAIILLLFGLLFYWVIRQHNESQQAVSGRGRRTITGPVPVTYATATKGSIGVYLDAIGTVTPVYTDSITAQVTGVITSVHYREGQTVRKGDPLVDIDPRPYAAQLAEAQGALERDQNLLAEAQMDLERYKTAWAKNAIPRQTLEDQDKLVLQDQGTVKNDEGTVQYDQVQLAYCHITSPIEGRVGLRLVDPGNLVTANSTTTLVVVTQTTPITVIFTLAEDSLPEVLQQMHAGKALQVQAYDRSQQTLLSTGKLITVDNQIDTTTGTVKLRAEFNNAKSMLFPNQFVNTRLLVKTLENQTLVPSSAIQHNGSTDFVYVIQNIGAGNGRNRNPAAQNNPQNKSQGKAQNNPQDGQGQNAGSQGSEGATARAVMRKVTSGISDNGNTAVTGINPGTVVANSSFQKLVNNSPVYQSKVALPTTDESEDNAP